jgi:hypothetical protein
MPALLHHPAAIRLQTLRSTQETTSFHVFRSFRLTPVSFCRPFSARLRRGPDAVPSEDYSRWPPLLRGLLVKRATERDERQSTKKRP